MARAHLDAQELDVAYTRYRRVASENTNQFGAEAKYQMAYVRHLQERFLDAEKEVFELVQNFPAYDDWKARAFVLLGDVYVRMDDRFQAKAVLQSVIDNSTDPDLVAQARERLDRILNSEVLEVAPPEQEEIVVPMGEGNDTEE